MAARSKYTVSKSSFGISSFHRQGYWPDRFCIPTRVCQSGRAGDLRSCMSKRVIQSTVGAMVSKIYSVELHGCLCRNSTVTAIPHSSPGYALDVFVYSPSTNPIASTRSTISMCLMFRWHIEAIAAEFLAARLCCLQQFNVLKPQERR